MQDFQAAISVVVATFNGESFLKKQLSSLRRQTLLPYEVIISDDCSTDQTNEIIISFQQNAPFRVIHRKNESAKGFRENFLSAIKYATGNWIAFCDQDDIWRLDKLEICTSYMSIPGISQIVHQANLIDENEAEIGYFDQGIKKTSLRGQLSFDVWSTFFGFSMIVKRRILEIIPTAHRFVDYIDSGHLIAHDRWAFFLAQTLGATVEIAQPLVAYRQHGKNLFGSDAAKGGDSSLTSIRLESAAYILATQSMLQIVEMLPSQIETEFIMFDRARAIEVYGAALHQLKNRGAIYTCDPTRGLLKIIVMCFHGEYRSPHSGRFRWRSLLRDIHTTIARY